MDNSLSIRRSVSHCLLGSFARPLNACACQLPAVANFQSRLRSRGGRTLSTQAHWSQDSSYRRGLAPVENVGQTRRTSPLPAVFPEAHTRCLMNLEWQARDVSR